MSSHREAPEISKDPVADNTDTYAFVSPDRPDTVTIISNYIPLEDPAGGPNFFEFGDDVLYRINVDNSGDGKADVAYEFRFNTTIRNKETFLYNTGPIDSVSSPNFNRPQTFTVTEVRGNKRKTLGKNLAIAALQHRPALHPQLPGAGQLHHRRRRRRHQGIRRAAARRVLRRPRCGLRPRRCCGRSRTCT